MGFLREAEVRITQGETAGKICPNYGRCRLSNSPSRSSAAVWATRSARSRQGQRGTGNARIGLAEHRHPYRQGGHHRDHSDRVPVTHVIWRPIWTLALAHWAPPC